ncbi:probable E3 ubiquitin-protein ligase HERC4 isoform X2 [Toxorhynchites rutilus septentrionalis]|uniref:probable E3 ubiquitin-protein ligase HERC4 isoform X2 n=1 Tax=Toxorhynchites rutilus septentrionalis TaxID=329112 RepID=UPI0024791ECE|nr:probable E3 ubiquitin-protein ligase HERC4 isoform X2 [Toxorhynchites rutilus septentrionalis]
MAVYCWGSTVHGELGLGGIEEEQVMLPREMDWCHAPTVEKAACGGSHTLLLTKEGKLFSCGNNDYGQLGHDTASLPNKRPQYVSSLENYAITQICCGTSHSLVLTNWGQLFSWGSNLLGQLGHDTELTNYPTPRMIKTIATKHVVQIASGQFHCLALTNNGELYSWGANGYGQLGQGKTNEKIVNPTLIKSLAGIPIAFIACGGNHSFAISKSGAIFGWGKNTFGQLGLNDLSSRCYPTQLKTLRSLSVRYISCGDDFSVFLTNEGGVFTCGAGTFGQLGHGTCSNEILPRMVFELMGSKITQIACGRRHTLAFVPSRGKIYGFGLGGVGQLGVGVSASYNTPQIVRGPWIDYGSGRLSRTSLESSTQLFVSRIFSGGDQCFVSLLTDYTKDDGPADYRLYDPSTQILTITEDINKTIATIQPDETIDMDLISTVETVFKSLACINGSWLLPNDMHFCCTSKHPGVDVGAAEETFEHIRKIEHDTLKQLIWEAISVDLLGSLVASPADVETLRAYVTLPVYHEFINSKNYLKLHTPFSQAVQNLMDVPFKIVAQWWSKQTKDYFERMVENFKNVILYIINFKFTKVVGSEEKQPVRYEANLASMLNIMAILYKINHTQRSQKLPYEQFHINEIDDLLDIRMDYVRWIMDSGGNYFSLCNYPFIFNASSKTLLLQTDQSIQMTEAMQNAACVNFFSMFQSDPHNASQFIVLNVTRDNIVQDTIRELAQYTANDLKKPLKIRFHGEEAEDAGGVRKEFFMLLLKDILDPKYGMFKTFEESRSIWFTEDYFENEDSMFALIGILCGLAIYNFTIINLPFPLVLYKKLLDEEVELSDLMDLSPTLARSMQSILDYSEPDLEEVFDLTFSTTRDYFGEMQSIELKAGGEKIRVNQDNKDEFVKLYIDYMLNKSVENSFKQFRFGFMKVCGGRVLKLFKAHELMAVVIGNEEYDWMALEEQAVYKNGYKSSDQTIRWFWEVFHELSLEEKKNFLLFLTGCDRIPIQGMKAIKIYIQPTTDDKFLPVAHTCFNLLDLPQYKTKEKLKYKLLQAIQQTQGFSLV